MPEIKHNFTKGKMNKDLDERLVPNGEYRDAMNIQVATSEGSDVGTVQNVLGNKEVTVLIPVLVGEPTATFTMPPNANVVGSISDEKIDTMYYLVWSNTVDWILSWKRGDVSPEFVFIDMDKEVLKLPRNKIITGINVIDGMLFWTDGVNEPRKINIQRCKDGTKTISQTRLINTAAGIDYNSNVDLEERHITVIKKGPQVAPDMKLHTVRDLDKNYTAVMTISSVADVNGDLNSFTYDSASNGIHDFSSLSTQEGSNKFWVKLSTSYFGAVLDGANTELTYLDPLDALEGLTGWGDVTSLIGLKVALQVYGEDNVPPGLPLTDFVIKGEIFAAPTTGPGAGTLGIQATTVDGFPPQTELGEPTRRYVIDLFEEEEKLFEFKFPRFSYRYKFEDGEYSTFAPFTQVAFTPGSFDYHPRKGYNIGMTNKLRKVELLNIITADTPSDVIAIDVLFKDDSSPSIYIVDTIKPDDYALPNTLNLWDKMLFASSHPNQPQDSFEIDREAISSIIPSNQLLRPWDNVPKKALAQDITGNRIVYANYAQNYDLISQSGKKYVPTFLITTSSDINAQNTLDPSTNTTANAFKSIKSLREYQLGVVFLDEHGRETPVISNASGTKLLDKRDGADANRFKAEFSSDDYPQSLTHFKFFVKETSSGYYNMAMDRWYSAGDGNIWLAFPSSDRNKIDIDTFLILKKGSDSNDLVTDAARYKVLAIESEAPDFIKTTKRKAFKKNHVAGGTLQNVIFQPTNADLPFEGATDFQMNYAAFHGTSGQDLAVTEDELYIEFSKAGVDEVSARYKINSVTNSWKPSLGVNFDLEDVFSIELDEPLGSDVNFITDDLSGANPNIITDNTIVTVYKYKTENLDRFDGRFFVKIYFDEVFRTNIETTTIGGGLRVSGSKKVYSMHSDLVATHTSNLGNFLTRGKGGTRADVDPDWSPCKGNTPADGIEPVGAIAQMVYGYYTINEFAANAIYFRRYREKRYSKHGGSFDYGYTQTAANANILNLNEATNRLNNTKKVRALVHLQKGGTSNGENLDHNVEINGVQYASPHIEYKGKYWRDHEDWFREFGYHTSTHGLGKRAEGYLDEWTRGVTSMWKSEQYGASYGVRYLEDPGGYKSDEETVRQTEVWFIDKGPFTGANDSVTGELRWTQSIYHPGAVNTGLQSPTNAPWSMKLGFGGITSAEWDGINIRPNFWNVGNWNQPVTGSNGSYTDPQTTNFINNIGTGYQLRWKEDFDNITPYTVDGTVGQAGLMRHSDGPKLPLFFNDPDDFPYSTPRDSFTTNISINTTDDLRSMAEGLSFNLTKIWRLTGIIPAISWDPTETGLISGGLIKGLKCVDVNGLSTGNGNTVTGLTCSGLAAADLTVYVENITTTSATTNQSSTLHEGMMLTDFQRNNDTFFAGEWVVREIIKRNLPSGDKYYELKLGGYLKPFKQLDHNNLFGTTNASLGGGLQNNVSSPKIGGTMTFKQVGMNGYSPNSEFNINTISRYSDTNVRGAIAAVGYTLEFVESIQPTEVLSENPAIWETEPKEATDLDIYYEACGSIPTVINKETVASAFPIGTKFLNNGNAYTVFGYSDDTIKVTSNQSTAPTANSEVEFLRPDDLIITTNIAAVSTGNPPWFVGFPVAIPLINSKFTLPWHNCYTFKNGVESNRIRDNYNLPYISNGVKASTTLEQEYKEEHRKYGLIYSGIYNSTSGINNLNQFIQAEKITKDINPIYGSIQKLYSRDSDLVALCEDKILRISANKDALYNADGNPQLIATNRVLGQTIPFAGEYGISTNPESFAAESYRAYFTDRVRGTVMRLSKDGLTPISDAGMKDYFRDNLKNATQLIGSYDDRNDEYNLTIKRLPKQLVRVIGSAPSDDAQA